MSPSEARHLLNPENLRTAALVMAALDTLQSIEFEKNIGPKLRDIRPHSESDLVEGGKRAAHDFSIASIPGNGAGLKMNVSVFLNALRLLHLNMRALVVLKTLAEFEKTSESPAP